MRSQRVAAVIKTAGEPVFDTSSMTNPPGPRPNEIAQRTCPPGEGCDWPGRRGMPGPIRRGVQPRVAPRRTTELGTTRDATQGPSGTTGVHARASARTALKI